MFSRETVGLFDYVMTDSMTWTDNRGSGCGYGYPTKWVQSQTAGIHGHARGPGRRHSGEGAGGHLCEPDLPAGSLAKQYETLWTEERRKKVIGAAARNGVAIEINDRYHLPSPSFIKMAKEEAAVHVWDQ